MLAGNLDFAEDEVVKALSFREVQSISNQFARLNPYNSSLVREILKIEDVNFEGSDPRRPQRQLFGYGIAAKRYALYTVDKGELSIVKASGHGLGYLFAPKKTKGDEEDESGDNEKVPQCIVEAWDWLLRKELRLKSREPNWLALPAMMRMTMSTPNVMRNNRPEWLAPFNFFLFPILSDLGGYPAAFDRSNFKFIIPFESDCSKWRSLEGINLLNEQIYRVAMRPDKNQTTVVPDSFRIILNQYLRHPEAKSLAPDGTSCVGNAMGLLQRASILAGDIVPIGKETDRHWEQGEDPGLMDFKVREFRKKEKLVVAEISERKKWREAGLRYGMRKSGLSQKAVSAILNGEPVRLATLAVFSHALKE